MAHKRVRKPSSSRSLSSAHRARGRSPTRSPKSLDRRDNKHGNARDRSRTKSPVPTDAWDNEQVAPDSVPEKSPSPSSKERHCDRGRSKAPVPWVVTGKGLGLRALNAHNAASGSWALGA